jgi:O-antigen/teichoic acid export membrane protein
MGLSVNTKVRILIKNFSYSFLSNFVSLVISTLVISIVPKILGFKEYGYWQLYLFYTSYTALLHFGWNDGIYLRYGGKEYNQLDKNLFFSQFWMLTIFEFFITVCTILLVGFFVDDFNKLYILKMMVFCSLIVIPRGMLLFILQGTNRIKEYAKATIIDRIIFCLLMVVLISIGIKKYQTMITADIIGRFISILYTIYCCRDIVFRKFSSFYLSFTETIENIRAGIKISFAYIANILIVGTVRFGIEYVWNIETFGKVSLTLSISNLMMVFVNAVGVIMFPVLRRTDELQLPNIYLIMRSFLTTLLIGFLILYYPLKVFMSAWLPRYAESLKYMAILFPMTMFEGKMALLINTYLKTLRKEKLILFINFLSLVFSVFSTVIFVIIFKNLTLSVLAIIILLAFRCVLAEAFLSRVLKINVNFDIILELAVTGLFILTGWFTDVWLGLSLFLLVLSIYLVIKYKDINKTLKKLIILFKS